MRHRIYLWMAVVVVLLLLFSSCRSVKYVPVQTVKTDSLYFSVHHRDSIHIRDSVYVKDKGDTVFVSKWHTEYRDRDVHDTTYIYKTDSIQVPYLVEGDLTWWQNVKQEAGDIAIGMVVELCFIIVYLIRKNRKK